MTSKVRASRLSDEQKYRRAIMLETLAECVAVFSEKLKEPLGTEKLAEHRREFVTLRKLHGLFRAEKDRYDGLAAMFFVNKEVGSFLKTEGVETLSSFLGKPLSLLYSHCKMVGEHMPIALDLLYVKYNEKKSRMPAPVAKVGQQQWFSSLYRM